MFTPLPSRHSNTVLASISVIAAVFGAVLVGPSSLRADDQLPNVKPLEWEGDIASRLVDASDSFLLGELEKSVAGRAKWFAQRDFSSNKAYEASLADNRERLSHILGLRDKRVAFDGLELLGTTAHPALVGRGAGYKIHAVRWPSVGDMHSEGLLLTPEVSHAIDVIAIPDADQTPEMIAGIQEGLAPELQFARRLAESGCRVLIPTLVDRTFETRRRAQMTSREYIYRSAFELGRHVIGYEVQKIQAGIDWFEKLAGGDQKVGVVGWGEGGMLALYTAAVDTRVDACCVSGYFDARESIWQQPLSRNVFGLLERFGDAELASMVAPRSLVIDAGKGPELTLPSKGGTPAVLTSPKLDAVRTEFARAKKLLEKLEDPSLQLIESEIKGVSQEGLAAFLGHWDIQLSDLKKQPRSLRTSFDVKERQARLIHEMDRHNQSALRESPFVRDDFMKKLDTSSLAKYTESVKPYRDHFREEVIGHYPYELAPFNARTRKVYDEEKWTGHQVVLDVFDGVFAYGVLLVPKDARPGDRRPVVVCQHGLEGRPKDVITGNHYAYHDFAAKLAERGFVTFAPQNIYIFKDRFRTLQRKSYPLKKTLFSIIVPQHQQIVNWLSELPYVDKDRIAFYGLSYGGKSAMRIPPLVENYCLSICSADFNEWVRKNASTRHGFSYVWTGEYEIFEWDLGSTFNYAEMAALICPRPFMVERGHFDGVGEDEWVGYEFGKVRHLYAAKLQIPDRCEIEWFYGKYKGVHTINGQGTFDFLHHHLKWPKPK